jgi:hypothetical protein
MGIRATRKAEKAEGRNHDFTVQFAGHEHIAIVTNYMGNKVSSKDGESHATGMPL